MKGTTTFNGVCDAGRHRASLVGYNLCNWWAKLANPYWMDELDEDRNERDSKATWLTLFARAYRSKWTQPE